MNENNSQESKSQTPQNKKQFFRSQNDRIIAGVCGGIADFYGVSSLGVRIIFILLIFLNGIGLIAYLIGAFFIPNSSIDFTSATPKEKAKEFIYDIKKGMRKVADQFQGKGNSDDNKDIFKTILIVLVSIVLLHTILPWYFIWIATEILLVVAIIIIVLYIIYRK